MCRAQDEHGQHVETRSTSAEIRKSRKHHSVVGAQDVCKGRCYSDCTVQNSVAQKFARLCLPALAPKKDTRGRNSREQVSCRKRKHAEYSRNAKRRRAKRSVCETPDTETYLVETRQAGYKRTHFQGMSARCIMTEASAFKEPYEPMSTHSPRLSTSVAAVIPSW